MIRFRTIIFALAASARLWGDSGPEVVMLRNLCAGPVGDPLPPLRENRPSAAQMASQPRAHPYLLLNSGRDGKIALRAQTAPGKAFAGAILAEAQKDLTVPIPPLAAVYEGIPRFLPDGSFNPAEELHHYDDFYQQAYVVKRIIPVLGLAYQLTGEERFATAGREWLLNYARRPKLARKDREADFDAANMAFGLGLGYDWLAPRLSESERGEVRAALVRVLLPIAARGRELLDKSDPQKMRTVYANNHQSRTFGLFGVAALALLYEVPQARGWVDLDIQLMRDRILPSTWAPDGEYPDEEDHFSASLNDPIPFLVALERMGGENLFHDPRLEPRFRAIPAYYLYGLEGTFRPPQGDFGWLALAAELKDGAAQWIDSSPAALRRVDPLYGCLFYDPDVPAAAPADPGSVYFPFTGMVKLCSDWSSKGFLVPFRCGAQIAKDLGDQNGFRLRAGGEWLLPRLRTEWPLTEPPVEYHWALQGWFRGAAQNVLMIEPSQIGDAAEFDRTGKVPMAGGIQSAAWAPAVKLQDNQWLAGPEVPKSGELRAVQFGAAIDYVCGEAHRAYPRYQPALWVRHLLMVKASVGGPPPYLLECDEVDGGSAPQTYAWQVMSGLPLSVRGSTVAIAGSHASLEVNLLAPAEDRIVIKQTPAPESERTSFVQWTTPAPAARCFYLTALVPRTAGDTRPISFEVVPATGGWAVRIKSGTTEDLALFRSDQAHAVTAHGFTTASAAEFIRLSPGHAVRYPLGSN